MSIPTIHQEVHKLLSQTIQGFIFLPIPRVRCLIHTVALERPSLHTHVHRHILPILFVRHFVNWDVLCVVVFQAVLVDALFVA